MITQIAPFFNENFRTVQGIIDGQKWIFGRFTRFSKTFQFSIDLSDFFVIIRNDATRNGGVSHMKMTYQPKKETESESSRFQKKNEYSRRKKSFGR